MKERVQRNTLTLQSETNVSKIYFDTNRYIIELPFNFLLTKSKISALPFYANLNVLKLSCVNI